jgi:outer membrane protein assembly factor BamB
VRLRQVSRRKNAITDDDAWFRRNGLNLPTLALPDPAADAPGGLPEGLPTTLEGNAVVAAFASADGGKTVLAVYGPEFGAARYVVAWDVGAKGFRYAFDLDKFRAPSGKVLKLTGVNYAREEAGTLYLINDAGGYAKDWRGENGYLTAIDTATGKLLWRSAPLTANSRTLELVGEAVVCGYGFTNEPDFLFVLDRRTGRVLQKIPLTSAADYLFRKGDRLYVRCYDTDYVFAVTGG